LTAIEREFVSRPSPTTPQNGAGYMPTQGLYYRPSGSRPKTAIIATHYNVDFSEHYMAELMAVRGIVNHHCSAYSAGLKAHGARSERQAPGSRNEFDRRTTSTPRVPRGQR
jgi:hypothetical protein